MGDSGAPTGKWNALPEHLGEEPEATDLSQLGASLVVRRPGLPAVTIPLEKAEFLIGRQANEVDLALDDEMVSRKHARIFLDDRGYVRVEDLGSRNGMEFRGRAVKRLNLVDGDVFSIGKTEFEVHGKLKRFDGVVPNPKEQGIDAENSIMGDVVVPVPDPAERPPSGKPSNEG